MACELYFEEHMKEQEIDVLQFINFPDISKMETFEEKTRCHTKNLLLAERKGATRLGIEYWYRKAGAGL